MHKIKISLLITFILLVQNFSIAKEFDFSKTLGIKVNMNQSEVFKLLEKNKLKSIKGNSKYNQEYYTIDCHLNIFNARTKQLEIGIKEKIVDFISFDIADTDVNNFASTLREISNCYEDIRDVGYRLTKFSFDNCTISLVYFLDDGKTSFIFIDNIVKQCDKE